MLSDLAVLIDQLTVLLNSSAETTKEETETETKVTSKHLFTSEGIYYGSHMFGLYHKKGFYLRAKDDLAQKLLDLGAIKWDELKTTEKLKLHDYYLIPENYFLSKEKGIIFAELINESLEQIKTEKKNLLNEKKNPSDPSPESH